jgi:hypothetical protein
MRRVETIPWDGTEPKRPGERSPEQIRSELWLELLSAKSEPERAVLRCALNLLKGAQAFEIDPVYGVSYTEDGFERAAASWATEYAWYTRDGNPDPYGHRHDLVMKARQVQADYAAVHPHLAEPVWFPDHGPHNCVFCLMAANEVAGLPYDTGMDSVTGSIVKPEPAETVAVPLPGMEDAA